MTGTTRDQPPGVTSAVVKATFSWAVIGILAAVNGVVREALLEPALGPTLALTLCGLMLAVLVLTAITVAPWLTDKVRRQV